MRHTHRYRAYEHDVYRPRHPPLNDMRVPSVNSMALGQIRGEGFADLIHWDLKFDDRFILDHRFEDDAVSEENERQGHATNYPDTSNISAEPPTFIEPEGPGTAHQADLQVIRSVVTTSSSDDFMKNFLRSLRPSLEAHVESFGRLGIDSKVTLKAFSQWNAWDRERWITSQNVYLGLTPLEIGAFMLGVEKLGEQHNS